VADLLAELGFERPRCMHRAACTGKLGMFFPSKSAAHASNEAARRICATCPVYDECLAYALADPTLAGTWAGTTEAERRGMRKSAA
jgi:WhiB family transcriptional regulator, redox-sensing transcriptional regulator